MLISENKIASLIYGILRHWTIVIVDVYQTNGSIVAVNSTDSTQPVYIDIGVNPVTDTLCELLPTAVFSESLIFDELFGTFHVNYKRFLKDIISGCDQSQEVKASKNMKYLN